jgi:DNA-binding NarL/FixJ family response regulator
MPDVAPVRIGLVEDHEVVGYGLREILRWQAGWNLVKVVRSVGELDLDEASYSLVLLDLRLDDGSSPGDNIRILQAHGIPVLAYTAGEDVELLRAAAKAGILGIVRKSDDVAVLIDAIERALRGEATATTEWAAAIDGDRLLADARLSPREREVLGHYAAGETAAGVAEIMGLSRETVANYVGRIRFKYAAVGRPAATKVHLHRRAIEDGLLEPDGEGVG